MLTEAELISIIIAANAMQGRLFGDFGKDVVTLVDKLSAYGPESLSVDLEDWQNAISFHYIGEPKFCPKIFHMLVQAIATRQQLKITYHTPEKEPGERLVEPWGLAFINHQWVLFAYCHKNKTMRRFIPPRMSEMSETGEKFVRPKDFRVADHLQDTFGVYNSDVIHDVVLHFEKKIAHEVDERCWPPQHHIERLPDGSVNLHMKLSHFHDILEFILGKGGKIYPLAPRELNELFDAASDNMRSKRELRAKYETEFKV